jgi:hypothetical protein
MLCDSPAQDNNNTFESVTIANKIPCNSKELFGKELSSKWTFSSLLLKNATPSHYHGANKQTLKTGKKAGNPFTDYHDVSPPSSPIGSKILARKGFPLKFKDQNSIKPPFPMPKCVFQASNKAAVNHWKSRSISLKPQRSCSSIICNVSLIPFYIY